MPFVSALFLSSLVGMSLGLLGGGGSILAMPILVYVAHVDPHAAVPMSLAMVGTTSLLAAAMHRTEQRIEGKTALLFAGVGAVGAAAGARLTFLVAPATLLTIFGALMLVVGAWMYFGGTSRVSAGPARRSFARIVAAAAIVGVLTGFLGVGGGFLIVPALVLFAGLEMPVAVGTSLVVIAANSAAAFASHASRTSFDVSQTLAFTAAASAGAWGGFRLVGRLSPARLRRAFAVAVVAVGMFVVYKNL